MGTSMKSQEVSVLSFGPLDSKSPPSPHKVNSEGVMSFSKLFFGNNLLLFLFLF